MRKYVAAFALLISFSSIAGVLPVGNAAWLYELAGGGPAQWAPWITGFNAGAVRPFKSIYVYGGDMAYYEGATDPMQTYFYEESRLNALHYKYLTGVENVILVIDGWMNGGGESPNLAILTAAQVRQWASKTAQLYCSFDYVDGLQIDLEPANSTFLPNLTIFMQQLASDLLLTQNNCKNPNHPDGRSVGIFLGANSAKTTMFAALGTNGYVVLSGYDLGSAGPGVPTTPANYQAALTTSINTLVKNAGTTGSFVIGIPAAASTQEFTTYMPANGTPVQGFPMYSATQPSYVVSAINTMRALLTGKPQWLGTALWAFTPKIAYPNRSNNLFLPSMPFVQAGAFQYLQQNL